LILGLTISGIVSPSVGTHLPGDTAALHVVGQCNIVAPNIKLPLSEAKDAAENVARVDADSHVNIYAGRLTHVSAGINEE